MYDEMLAEAHDYFALVDVASIVDNDGLLLTLESLLPLLNNPAQEHITNKIINLLKENSNALYSNTPTLSLVSKL